MSTLNCGYKSLYNKLLENVRIISPTLSTSNLRVVYEYTKVRRVPLLDLLGLDTKIQNPKSEIFSTEQ